MTNTDYYIQEEESEEEELHRTSLYFVLFSGMLAGVLILAKLLHESPSIHNYISEAAMILLTGTFVGGCIWTFHPGFEPYAAEYHGEYVEDRLAHSLLSFSPNVFFMALLPPIIFCSGYQLRRELFYRHIRPIVMFACLGTTICAFATGGLIYGLSELGWLGQFRPSLVECLTYGSLIAATDTVSVLGVFQAKRVDPHLFYLVFGESALNDAVALVLFSTFSELLVSEVHNDARSVSLQIAGFLWTLSSEAILSPVLGIFFSFAAALVFKHMDFRNTPALELPLYVLLLYAPFVMAECFHLSGIVSIFFCGISARRYIVPNVSEDTTRNAEVIFKLTSYLAETCIFLELGLSVFGLPGSFHWRFIASAFVASLIGRALGIYPLAYLHNFSLKESEDKVPQVIIPPIELRHSVDGFVALDEYSHQLPEKPPRTPTTAKKHRRTPVKRKDKHISPAFAHVIWFSGLRGAVAYACVRKFPNVLGHTDAFTAATMVIVLVSTIVMGGATGTLLRKLDIDVDVDEEEYMKEWRKTKRLRGFYHRFEYEWIFRTVVRDIRPIGSPVTSFDESSHVGDDLSDTGHSLPSSLPLPPRSPPREILRRAVSSVSNQTPTIEESDERDECS